MSRILKPNNESREEYAYFAYPKKLNRTLQAIVQEEAGKYGIENVKDLLKNIVMQTIIHYEKNRRYIEAIEWATENWRKNGYSDLSATNVDDKLNPDAIQLLDVTEKHLKDELERVRKLKHKHSLVVCPPLKSRR